MQLLHVCSLCQGSWVADAAFSVYVHCLFSTCSISGFIMFSRVLTGLSSSSSWVAVFKPSVYLGSASVLLLGCRHMLSSFSQPVISCSFNKHQLSPRVLHLGHLFLSSTHETPDTFHALDSVKWTRRTGGTISSWYRVDTHAKLFKSQIATNFAHTLWLTINLKNVNECEEIDQLINMILFSFKCRLTGMWKKGEMCHQPIIRDGQ